MCLLLLAAVPSRPPKVSSQCSEESEDGSKQASKSCPTCEYKHTHTKHTHKKKPTVYIYPEVQNSIEESSDDSTAGDISPAEGGMSNTLIVKIEM